MSERATPSAKRPDPIPADYRGATPYLCVHDGKGALEFYQRAFGAKETMRMAQPDGRIGHAEFRICHAVIMLADEFPEMGFRSPKTLGGSPVNLLVYVPDVDAFVKQAEGAGATVQRPPADQFYGDRMATLTDPYGHGWSIATHVEVKERLVAPMATGAASSQPACITRRCSAPPARSPR